jgi:hypothetical protein
VAGKSTILWIHLWRRSGIHSEAVSFKRPKLFDSVYTKFTSDSQVLDVFVELNLLTRVGSNILMIEFKTN